MGRDSEYSDQSSDRNFEEKLIVAIQNYPCLFDKRSISYRKRAVKQKAWHKVANDVRSEVKECQHRWRSLRDRYVREMRSKPNCKWRYMSQLIFLNPHLDSRNTSKTECMTDEESCSYSEVNTTIANEGNTTCVEEKAVPKVPFPKFEAKKEVEEIIEIADVDADVEVEGIPTQDEMSYYSFMYGNNSTETAGRCEIKRRRMDSVESLERFGEGSEVNSAEIENIAKSRNEDYYKTLDSYMLQLPLRVQDDLKIELLNRVYCELKKQ